MEHIMTEQKRIEQFLLEEIGWDADDCIAISHAATTSIYFENNEKNEEELKKLSDDNLRMVRMALISHNANLAMALRNINKHILD